MTETTAARRELLLGDEAIALAAMHAGISGAFGYPGTPSTEIFEYIQKHKDEEVSARWATNEKVGYEEALGMSYAGKRSIVTMKHVGLNVAADAFMNSGITGVNGGLVLAVADDPGMHSSQNEQDSRYFANFALIPCLEPTDQQMAYDMVRQAFDISERLRLPVMVRVVTRLAHSRAVVTTGTPRERNELNPSEGRSWILLPTNARIGYRRLVERQPEIKAALAEVGCARRLGPKKGELSVIASGIALNYLRECFPDDAELPPTLHVTGYPLLDEPMEEIIAAGDEVLVLEDGYPFIEEKLTGFPAKGRAKVHGKYTGAVPRTGELTPDLVRAALHRAGATISEANGPLAPRPPMLCSGCPHAVALEALNASMRAVPGGRVFSDIGCYTLGALPPYEAIHSCVDMGASISMAIGAARAGLKPAVAVIGDSTFMHSGITPLVDAAQENTPVTVVILDNSTVGMTGGQQTAATSTILQALPAALGIDEAHVRVVTPVPKQREEISQVLTEEMQHPGVSVVIAAKICIQESKRRIRAKKAAEKETTE